jgi:pimeloyl-ACP methyl ester carboxylesterase
MQIRELGILAAAAYESTAPAGYAEMRRHSAGGALNGFQAVAFQAGSGVVVAFRGTEQRVDVGVDLMLGLGANTPYFSLGEQFVQQLGTGANIILTGHSLGGAIAQIVANRLRLPMVTFNAPGVAVFASRNILTASPALTAVRAGGMLASAIAAPGQAWRDMRSSFHRVRGLNVCLANDAVSMYGVHYGEVIRITGTSINPLTEHSIATVNAVLAQPGHPVGSREAVFS